MLAKVKDSIKNYVLDIWNTKSKRVMVLLYLITPIILTIIIEGFNRRTFIGGFEFLITSPSVFFINTMITWALLSVSLVFRNRIPIMAIISVVWLGMGIANYVIKGNRETPFSRSDLQDIGGVIDIVGKYMSNGQIVFFAILIVFVVIAISYGWKKCPRYTEKVNYIRNAIYIVCIWLAMVGSVKIGQHFDKVSVKFPNMSIAYENYGFTYCFAYSFVSVGVEKPESYTSEDLEAIAKRIDSEVTVDKENVQTPNIIYLQLESFIDLNMVEGLKLSTEATPNFTSLKNEYTSGYLTVNNIGYGTANTEFEIMTGMNLEDFGPGEFPYKTILKEETCESMSYILREYGYVSHAMHNNTGSFYSRNKVFKNLGYDTYTSLEYMYPEEYTYLGWAKDEVLTDEIMKVLNSTDEPDYIYSISVQGHGAYPTDEVLEEPTVEILEGVDDEERLNQITYYANQIYEMDLFIGELINELNKYDEEVILVMYGDHLPSLGFTEEELITHNLYQTEYIVWSNYGFEMEDKDVETFQLASRIFEHLNIDGGIINKFHQVYQEEDDYLECLKKLEYDILYGSKYVYGGTSPYVATDLQMGTYLVEIDNVYLEDINNPVKRPIVKKDAENDESIMDIFTGDEQTQTEAVVEPGWIVVEGKHFTEYSHVFVNNEKCETIYINENMVLGYCPEIESLAEVTIKQMWKEKTVISVSEGFMYVEVTNNEETE